MNRPPHPLETAMRTPIPHADSSARSAFTLLEMSIVVMVTGILAVAAIPALGSVDDMNAAAARSEIEGQVVLARGRAQASGQPHGLRLVLRGSIFQPLRIAATAGPPTPALNALGNEVAEIALDGLFAKARITEFENGDRSRGDGTLWFGYDGTPQIRDEKGRVSGTFASSATISLTGGFRVVVSPSGAIDR